MGDEVTAVAVQVHRAVFPSPLVVCGLGGGGGFRRGFCFCCTETAAASSANGGVGRREERIRKRPSTRGRKPSVVTNSQCHCATISLPLSWSNFCLALHEGLHYSFLSSVAPPPNQPPTQPANSLPSSGLSTQRHSPLRH